MVNKHLIQRYIRNECNEEERRLVESYMDQHPEEWNAWLNEEDWEDFEPSGDTESIPTTRMFEAVSRLKNRSGKTLPLRPWRRYVVAASVAASLVVVVSLSFLFSGRDEAGGKPGGGEQPAALASLPLKQTRENRGDRELRFTLQDGSVVSLAPGSSITYNDPFVAAGKREVYLNGLASFQVAKDAANPFTVFSGEISTTALGTWFTVDAYAEMGYTKVNLHEGKVVVRPVEKTADQKMEDMYLLPGDELRYEKKTGLAFVSRAKTKETLVKASPRKNSTKIAVKPEWYKFSGQLLTEVLDQLSQYYQVDFYYYPSQLKNMYLTGRIEKTDSLDAVLTDIALLHGLVIRKEKSGYIISKE